MPVTELSLPVDIPWKRMAVSEDMIANRFGERSFPEKWKSSVAVFYHEPSELLPDYCDRKITYLKVVCTISNYQWDPQQEGDLRDIAMKYGDYWEWNGPNPAVDGVTYPCYGALLQFAVYPNPTEGVELHDFPYISSIQPRKREMYEMTTESGEVASQSSDKINVLKVPRSRIRPRSMPWNLAVAAAISV